MGDPSGGGQEMSIDCHPPGDGYGGGGGGDIRYTGGAGTPPRGSHRTTGRVPTPFPPTEEGAAGGGQKGGAAAAPHADLVR